MKKKRSFTIEYFEYSINDITDQDKILIEKAKNIVKNAYAPYSNFSVGAALLLDNNEIICGTNQENIAFPSGLCAERTALFYANSKYPNIAINTIAIAAHNSIRFVKNPITPCGSCRQVMLETQKRFKKPIRVLLASETKIWEVSDVTYLMPLEFNEIFIKK